MKKLVLVINFYNKKKRYIRMAIVKWRMLVPKFTCLDNVNVQYPKVNGFSGADNVRITNGYL